jgi:hypothetical protein
MGQFQTSGGEKGSQMTEAARLDDSGGRRGNVRRSSKTRTAGSRRRNTASGSGIRSLYFSIAALWGYLLGIGLLAAVAGPSAQGFSLDGRIAMLLAAGAALSVLGGVISARAYIHARRR